MEMHYIHVSDAGIVLTDNMTFKGHHIICGGATYGRFIFTEPDPAITITGSNVAVEDCIIEVL